MPHQVGPAQVGPGGEPVPRRKDGHEGQFEQGVGGDVGIGFALGADTEIDLAGKPAR